MVTLSQKIDSHHFSKSKYSANSTSNALKISCEHYKLRMSSANKVDILSAAASAATTTSSPSFT